MDNETIDEIFEGIDLSVEYVTVELYGGGEVSLLKCEYDKLQRMYEDGEIGEFLY